MTKVKVLTLEDYRQKKRPEWVKPIREYETTRKVWEFFKTGYIHRIDKRTLPKIDGMEFHLYTTRFDYKTKTSTIFLVYKPT